MPHYMLGFCYSYPQVGKWKGDGLSTDIGIEAAGTILSDYAQACVTKVGISWRNERPAVCGM